MKKLFGLLFLLPVFAFGGATIGTPTGLPPSGAAGGVLSGFYPNPGFGSFTSSTLLSAISDGAGTGFAVFNNGPTLIAPVLGAATATTINGNTITPGTGTLTLGSATLNAGAGGTLGAAAFQGFASSVDTQTGLNALSSVTPASLASATILPAFSIQHFADKFAQIENGVTQQLTVLVWGDSVANLQLAYILPALAHSYGDLGTGTNPTSSIAGDVIVNNGGSVPYNYTYYLTGSYWDVGSTGSVVYGRGGGAARSNQIKVFYIEEPGAGTFTVQTAIGNGSFTTETGYTAVNASIGSGLQLGIITLNSSTSNVITGVSTYQVKVVGVTGRVKFISPFFQDTVESGIQVVHTERGGLGLDSANLMDSGLFTSYVNAINPDIAFFQMKEGSTYATSLPAHISRWNTAQPNTDWVYFLTTPESDDGSAYDSAWQNSITRTNAIANGNAVIDLHTPCKNYALMLSLGWLTMGDGTHPTAPCNQYLARLIASYLSVPIQVLGNVSQTNVINSAVSTASLNVSNGYSGSALGLTPALTVVPSSNIDITDTIQRTRTVNYGAGNSSGTYTISGPGPITLTVTGTNQGMNLNVGSGGTLTISGATNMTGNLGVTGVPTFTYANGTALFGNANGNNTIKVSRTGSGASYASLIASNNNPLIDFNGGSLLFSNNGGSSIGSLSTTGALSLNGSVTTVAGATASTFNFAGGTVLFGNSVNNNAIEVSRITTNPSYVKLLASTNNPVIDSSSTLGFSFNAGANVATLDTSGNLISNSTKTANPTSGTAAVWKLGSFVAGAPTGTSGYAQIDIAGAAYQVPTGSVSLTSGLDSRTGLTSSDGAAITLYTTVNSTSVLRITADIFATAAVTGTAIYTITWTQNSTTQTLVVNSTTLNTLATATDLINPDNATTVTARLTGTFTGTFTVTGLVERIK